MGHFRSKVMDESLKYIYFVCRGPSVEAWPCTSQFLKLGPEILTRDLGQAHQNSTRRTQEEKKNGRHMAGQKFSKIMELMKSQRFFFF